MTATMRGARRSTTPTGHRVGRLYYSIRNRSRYRVLGVATTWELAPGGSVRLRWENGNTTTSAVDRGSDPEVCPACDAVVGGPPWLDVAACRCPAGLAHADRPAS
ncbi:MAG: hypothetical protein ACLGIO_07075 [Acidimicrobiia bacterium]